MTLILIVEDVESLREEIVAILGYEGFTVMAAENGLVGVQLAKQHLPNLILCDVMMPELDGYGTLAVLRADPITSTIPFIFLTALADKVDIRHGMELGADDYLSKPFTNEELLAAITTRLAKYATIHQRYDHEIKQVEAKLEYLAHHDQLTNLPNRVQFHDYLKESILLAQAVDKPLALIFLDIDQFSIINNTLGHSIGDRLFVAIAERLRRFIQPCDLVARLRGDEFAIVMVDVDAVQAKSIAQKILAILAKPYKLFGHEIFITVSLGITLYPYDHQEVDGLIGNADMALHYAKEQGRNLYRFYNSEIGEKSSEIMALENSLRRAIDRNEFRLYYQPIVALDTGRIVGVEALIRWQHPELGLIMPSRFIPLAEKTSLILNLGEWVIETACKQSLAWQSANLPPLYMAVNLSGLHFKTDNFIETISNIVNTSGMSPQYLHIELTESIIMQNAGETVAMLSKLRTMGIGIAIDDFGTGYSSLSYLKHFPVDVLKIDRSFIQDLLCDRHDSTITTAIIDLAHSLSLSVVAEGVETQEQLDFLRENHCDRIQGYVFSPPVTAEQLEKFLLEGKCL